MTIEVTPPKKASPWRWVLLIGCGLVLLAMGACAGLAALGYGFFKSAVIMDPAQVTAMSEGMLPGATAPAGFKPQMGMDVAGFKMAMFGPAEGPDDSTIGVMQFPMKPEEFDWQQAIREMDQRGGDSGNEKVLSTEPTTLQLGGQEQPGIQQVVEDSGVRKIRKIAMLGTPTKDKVVMLLLESPEGTSRDEAFAAFGKGLRLDGFTVMGGAAASPAPAPTTAEEEPAVSEEESPAVP